MPRANDIAAHRQRFFRGAMVRFDQSAGPRVGVWDQAMNYGTHEKPSLAGTPLVTRFDRATCQQMLEDFAARKNDLFLDKQHEVTDESLASDEDMQAWGDQHALAWYSALCHVSDGQVVGYAAHAGAPDEPPSIEDLTRPDGTPPTDGLYAWRSAVTPRGADPIDGIPAFRYVSPYFFQRAGDAGEVYRLLNITATNDPFLDGVALAMSADKYAGASTPKEKPMEELYSRAGCMEADSPEQKLEKMSRYAQKMESERDAEKAEMARVKMEAEKVEEEKKAAMEAKPFEGKETPEEEKKEKAAMERRLKALEEKNAMLEAEVKAQSSTVAMEREARVKREQAEREAEAEEFATKAVAMGRVKPDHKGTPEKTAEWLKAARLKDAASAEDFLAAEGTFGISEPAVLQRMTRGGAGIGAPDPREQAKTPADVWDARIAEIQKTDKLGFDAAERVAMQRFPREHQAYLKNPITVRA